MTVPGYEIPEVEKSFLKALRVEDIDRVYPGPENVTFKLPNPKLQVEQGKMQVGLEKIKLEKTKMLLEMSEQKRINTATIEKLKAEAAKIVASIGTEKAETVIKHYELMLKALEAHNEILDRRSEMLSKETGDGETSDSGGGDGGQAGAGGSAQLAPASSNGAVSNGAGSMASGANGAMG
jgi:hypothetical protein